MDLRPITILLVEDNVGDARLIKEGLAEANVCSFELVQINRVSEIRRALDAHSIDAVLLDLSLPDSQGLDTLRRARDYAAGIPIVVLSGLNDETQAIKAVQEGAQDYHVKGCVQGSLLARSVCYAIERHRMHSELEKARSHEHYTATHDILTKLPNRQLFHDRLRHALVDARRHNEKVALLFLDLDRFKLTNDTLGHAVGDRLLQAVAGRIGKCIRESDTAARLGGDEFTVILTGITRAQDVARIARILLDSMAEPFQIGEHQLFITTSIGISIYPSDGTDDETLIKNADIAMYRAKASGKNNYQFYLPTMNDRAMEKMELEGHLRQALEREEFVLHYQPQLNVTTGEIIGMEALVRWQHPSHGLLYPGEFIPLAEESGLIVPLGEWVLRTACAQNKAWIDAGLPKVSMAVNYSARQFQCANPIDAILKAVRDTGLDPQYLELELTESAIMTDADFATATLRQLSKVGIQVSIDDFGTGYSSLSYLKRLPLAKLKIDEIFIRTLTVDQSDWAITSAIVAMARNLNLHPIAEGVETIEQLEALRSLECERMQGYLFSRPLDTVRATEILASRKVDFPLNIYSRLRSALSSREKASTSG